MANFSVKKQTELIVIPMEKTMKLPSKWVKVRLITTVSSSSFLKGSNPALYAKVVHFLCFSIFFVKKSGKKQRNIM